MNTLSQLRDAALPFVTRMLRGQRLRRSVTISAVMALLSVVLGAWLAMSDRAAERELREGFDLERHHWERERYEFVLVADHEDEHRALTLDRLRIAEAGHRWSRVQSAVDDGAATLRAVSAAGTPPPQYRELAARAEAVLAANEHLVSPDRHDAIASFGWHDRREIERLRAVVDAEMLPRIELYTSPLGPTDAVRITGMLAGALVGLLLLVVGPVLVGMRLAQEVHDNTLMPLTGTSLSPRQLAFGLAAGPLAFVGILLAPQVVLLLGSAALTGYAVPALGLLAIAGVGGLMLCALCQLYALAVGRRRTPGLAAVGLLVMLGMLLATGMGVGMNLDDDSAGLVALLPQVGVFHLWREAFIPAGRLGIHDAFVTDVALAIGTLGFAVLAAIAGLAVERRIAGRYGPSLHRWEAMVGALVSIVLAMFVLPEDMRIRHGDGFMLLTLALLALPFAALVMARVPIGDVPPALRRIPLAALAREYATFLGMYALVSLVLLHDAAHVDHLFHPVSLLYLGWSIAVLMLLAVRVVAVPLKLGSAVWVALSSVWLVMAYVQACIWTSEHRHGAADLGDLFVMWKLSPALGVLQVVLLVWVPWSLIRTLRRKTAGIH